MKKNIFTVFLIILIFILFSAFLNFYNSKSEVLEIVSPLKFGIDINKNKKVDADEYVCIPEIESFSVTPDDLMLDNYSKNLKLSTSDVISLGYIAQDFSQKVLLNRYVHIDKYKKVDVGCNWANISINGTQYSDIILHAGFALKNNKFLNYEKFKENLKYARKLNLVVFNHHSNKYHSLTCPYGKLAHDKVLLPQAQLPDDAKPCRICHHIISKYKKRYNKKFYNSYSFPINIKRPDLVYSNNNLKILLTDYSRNLKPDNSCQTSVCRKFVKLIKGSDKNIDMAIYGYDNIPAITKALEQAKKRGVVIRFIYDEAFDVNKTFYKDNLIIKNLSNKSISDRNKYKTNSNMIMHNKFVIFDNKTVFTGSLNISPTGMSDYDVNNVLVINSPDVANFYTLEFEQMLSGKFHTKKKILNYDNTFNLGNTILSVYFSPQDKTSNYIMPIIRNAKKYIYMPVFLITHKTITDELIKAHNRGVDVKIILDANSVYTTNSSYKKLKNAKIPVKVENYAGKMHIKSIIVDDLYVITGSMNLSNSGENKNDENSVIIKNTDITKFYKNFFIYLWIIIPDRYLKYYPKAEGKDSIGSCYDGVDNNFNGKIDKYDEACK